MSELEPRIVGTEWETAITLKRDNGLYLPAEGMELSAIIKSNLPNYVSRGEHVFAEMNEFLSNGARLYNDMNSHIEYATPEDDSFWGVVANEIAGEQIVHDMVSGYAHQNNINLKINKRVVDKRNETWGYHENYFMPRSTALPYDTRAGLLLAHLATRGLYGGAGYLDAQGKYHISQKIVSIESDTHTSTTCNKPLLNLRDEPWTGSDKRIGQRLHVTSGDATMSPWSTFLKLATTSIVLRLVEERQFAPESIIPFMSYAEAAHHFNNDSSLEVTAVMQDGKKRTMLDVQNILWEEAANFAKKRELPTEEQQAMHAWREILDDLATPDKKLATERLDWVAKGRAIARYAGKHGLAATDERLQGIDWRWDTISEDGVGIALRKTHWKPWVDSSLIHERTITAPTSTRAHVRGAFVEQIVDSDERVTVSWDRLNKNSKSILLPNPRNNDLSQLAA